VFEYFKKAFTMIFKSENKYDFKYDQKFQQEEDLQLKTYYGMVLKEFENIIRSHNKLIYFVQIVGCFLLNFYTMLVHVLAKYYGRSHSVVKILVNILCFEPTDEKVVEDDLFFVQVLVFWFFVDLGIYIAYYFTEENLITEHSDTIKEKCMECLILRFDLYVYKTERYTVSLMPIKSKAYLNAKLEFETAYNKANTIDFSDFNRQDTVKLSAKDVMSDDESENSDSNSNHSDRKSNEDSKEEEEITEGTDAVEVIPLSELTTLQDKVLFIYVNRNKYFFGRLLRSVLFNVPRLSISFMAVNLIYSESYLDFMLLAVCLIYSLRDCKVFFNSSFMLPVCFAIYFVLNWMILHFPKFEYEPYQKLSSLLLPKKPVNMTPRYSLLLGIGVFNLGFATMLIWIHYTCLKLLVIENKIGKTFHLTTADNFLVIDYKRWKKGAMNSMNFIFKMAHTLILEIFSLATFVICFFIDGHTYFKSPVILTVFLLIISEGVHSLKMLAKTLQEGKKTGSKQFIALCAKVMQVLCWLTVIIESLDVFKKMNFLFADDRPSMGVILIYYLSITVSDLVNSEEYDNNRKQIKSEEMLKTTYTALNMTYMKNEQKLFSRVSAFIGKEKLEKMAKGCVLEKDFENVKLYMDYNAKPLLQNLNDLYAELQSSYLTGLKLLGQQLLHFTYSHLNANVNHFRSQDLFVLYRNIIRRNSQLVTSNSLDLKSYFVSDYRQFENSLRETRHFYQLFKERDTSKVDQYNKKMEEFRKQAVQNKRYMEEGQTYTELSVYEWVYNEQLINSHLQEENKPTVKLIAAAGWLFKKVTRSTGKAGMVSFEDLKVELNKKGYINCVFDRLNIVLFNLKDDPLEDTQGFIVFNPKVVFSLVTRYFTSNIEFVATLLICVIGTFNGGLINVLVIGILLFTILIEETYGHLAWWKTLYVIFLIKLLISLFNTKYSNVMVFLLGKNAGTDIIQIIIINIVVFQQRKIGFQEEYMFNVEDMGSAVVRLVVNQDFDSFIERMTDLTKKKIEILVSYLDNKFKDTLSQEIYRQLKTKSTLTIVKVYLLIENYKIFGKSSAMRLFQRLKEDSFTNSLEHGSQFFWRNFSVYSRKPGLDLTPLIYLTLSVIIFFTIGLLQYNETATFTLLHFFSGTQAISSQTVITILFYIILLFIEKFFNSLRSIDSVGARYEGIFITFCKNVLLKQDYMRPKSDDILDSWRRAVKRLIIILKMKPKSSSKGNFRTNPFYTKYYFMVGLWVCVNINVFIVQPIVAHKNRNGLFNSDFTAMYCDQAKPDCYNYFKLFYSQIFYLLNLIYFFVAIQQIRKGKELSIPIETDYRNIRNLLSYYLYYKPPTLREICTLIEYSSQKTTLDINDWLLCEDLKEYMIKAKISHSTNEVKNLGTMVERKSRLIVSLAVLGSLVSLIIMPLLLFSKFTTGNQEQEIVSGSIKASLYSGKDRFILKLFSSDMMIENRRLSSLESPQPKARRRCSRTRRPRK